MTSLAPWFYRKLLGDNNIINPPVFYEVTTLSGDKMSEAACTLNLLLKPNWISVSSIYSNRDGSGTSPYQNIAVYKAISEALERWAFYGTADSDEATKYCFDINPSTTGMAAYPGFTARNARKNAILEATERWALHEFWRGNLPIREHESKIENLKHFEIITNIQEVRISLVCYKSENYYLYAFAADKFLNKSFEHALVELARNIRVMKKWKMILKPYHLNDGQSLPFANAKS